MATLQADLVAANAEIKKLRVLLVAKETLVLETPSLERLVDVLEALAQHLTRVDSLANLAKLAKILDPPLLTNRKDLTFES